MFRPSSVAAVSYRGTLQRGSRRVKLSRRCDTQRHRVTVLAVLTRSKRWALFQTRLRIPPQVHSATRLTPRHWRIPATHNDSFLPGSPRDRSCRLYDTVQVLACPWTFPVGVKDGIFVCRRGGDIDDGAVLMSTQDHHSRKGHEHEVRPQDFFKANKPFFYARNAQDSHVLGNLHWSVSLLRYERLLLHRRSARAISSMLRVCSSAPPPLKKKKSSSFSKQRTVIISCLFADCASSPISHHKWSVHPAKQNGKTG